jgi:hypothetical protein
MPITGGRWSLPCAYLGVWHGGGLGGGGGVAAAAGALASLRAATGMRYSRPVGPSTIIAGNFPFRMRLRSVLGWTPRRSAASVIVTVSSAMGSVESDCHGQWRLPSVGGVSLLPDSVEHSAAGGVWLVLPSVEGESGSCVRVTTPRVNGGPGTVLRDMARPVRGRRGVRRLTAARSGGRLGANGERSAASG